MSHATYRQDMEQKQTLYVSQPEFHQILKVKRIPHSKTAMLPPFSPELELPPLGEAELASNWEPFIGNGERCLPGDPDHCGDGGKAENARLAYPKGEDNFQLGSPRFLAREIPENGLFDPAFAKSILPLETVEEGLSSLESEKFFSFPHLFFLIR